MYNSSSSLVREKRKHGCGHRHKTFFYNQKFHFRVPSDFKTHKQILINEMSPQPQHNVFIFYRYSNAYDISAVDLTLLHASFWNHLHKIGKQLIGYKIRMSDVECMLKMQAARKYIAAWCISSCHVLSVQNRAIAMKIWEQDRPLSSRSPFHFNCIHNHIYTRILPTRRTSQGAEGRF